MKQLLKFAAVLMCAVILLGMSGCFLKTHRIATYFHTFEELSDFLAEYGNSNDMYLRPMFYVQKPEDNRFVDSAYIIYNTGGVQTSASGIANQFSLTAFKMEIDGEFVYLFGFHGNQLSNTGNYEYGKEISLDGVRNPISLSLEYDEDGKLRDSAAGMWVRDLLTKPYCDFVEGYAPVNNFVDEFLYLTDKGSDKFVDSCIWYGYDDFYGLETERLTNLGYAWGVYDTRDVSQVEKEALASELMEILYNNYKLAGEKTK